jgi:hypothetical protein
LLARVEKARGDAGVLLGHAVQGDQRQRDEQQAEPERRDQHRAEQLSWVTGVFGQPGEPEHPDGGRGRPGQDQRPGPDARPGLSA